MQTEALQTQEQIPETLVSTEEKDSKFSLDGNLWIQLGFLGALSVLLMYLLFLRLPHLIRLKATLAYIVTDLAQ